ncbi:Alpha/Beta hydrolase protein [Zopfochytrium polystomum]|nr:Alpha/Beta hydrolase protein [Zopfochytrium polystomum]
MTLQLPPPLPHAGDGHVHHRHEHDGHDDDHRDHHDLRGGEDGHDSDEEEADPVPVASGFVVFLPQQPPTPSTSSASTLPPKPKPSFLLTKHKPPPTPATPATAQSPIQIYYELHGTGTERLCLLTGLSASCSAWYSTITRLLRSRPNLAILAIDNRGAGASSTDDSLEPFSIRDLASDCERVLDHVGWTADVNLVGLSMGGMVALELLLLPNSRRRFRAAVLISTHAGRAVPTWTSIKHAFRTRAGQKRLPDDVDVFWKVKIMYPKPWLEQPAIARGRASPMGSSRGSSREAAGGGGSSRTSARAPSERDASQAKAILHHHVSSARLRAIGELGIPVHIVAGTDDQIVRLDATVKIHRKIPGSKLTVIKGAGHGIKDEAPDRLDQVFAETFGWL